MIFSTDIIVNYNVTQRAGREVGWVAVGVYAHVHMYICTYIHRYIKGSAAQHWSHWNSSRSLGMVESDKRK